MVGGPGAWTALWSTARPVLGHDSGSPRVSHLPACLVFPQSTSDPFLSIPPRPEQEPATDSFQVEYASGLSDRHTVVLSDFSFCPPCLLPCEW